MSKVIYIAGPYRGSSPAIILGNINVAEKYARQIWSIGGYALTPHLNTKLFDNIAPDHVFLSGTMELLRRSDAVFLLPKWETSQGTLNEIKEANKRNMPIFKHLFEVVKYLTTGEET